MKRVLIVIGVLVLLGVAYYGISPIFMRTALDEPLPTQETAPEEGAAVTGTLGHPAEGTARIVREDGVSYLRYENFSTLNGPDLYVYLSTDLEATEFVDLGRLKATEGNINYEIPENVNPEDYPYAIVWCKAFGVLFNSAQLY